MAGTLSVRRRVLAVLGGGFVGTITRSLLSQAIQNWLGKGWPFDILTINLTGALLFALVTVFAEATFLVGPTTRRLLVTTGFLGAYTTFSSLALGNVLLFSKGAWLPALCYLLASLCGGLAAILVGDWLGQACVRRFRPEHRPMEGRGRKAESGSSLTKRNEPIVSEQAEEFESRIP